MSADLELNGPVPVLYYIVDDHEADGHGWNVHYAHDAIACRYATLDEAIAELRAQITMPPPAAEDALSFDEAEAAGVDGTLRTF
jgi:hypothetical protein